MVSNFQNWVSILYIDVYFLLINKNSVLSEFFSQCYERITIYKQESVKKQCSE